MKQVKLFLSGLITCHHEAFFFATSSFDPDCRLVAYYFLLPGKRPLSAAHQFSDFALKIKGHSIQTFLQKGKLTFEIVFAEGKRIPLLRLYTSLSVRYPKLE
jgi:hypothetical protein